ncbi:MAG: hypothetical protein AB1567_05970 [bacterium]
MTNTLFYFILWYLKNKMIEIKEFLQKTDLLNKLGQITNIPLSIVDSKHQVFHPTKLCELVKHSGKCIGNHQTILSEVMALGKPSWGENVMPNI